ncbi:hypothetical protein [Paraburkholderia lycopersici]|uniref:hypothetical protein n=1 Tax=Paraburkholderia lycopersici TaxID=416944 RepID=UPI001161527C|nr:hypothetical protein [Paraburkholderia lycopersici]
MNQNTFMHCSCQLFENLKIAKKGNAAIAADAKARERAAHACAAHDRVERIRRQTECADAFPERLARRPVTAAPSSWGTSLGMGRVL